MPQTLLVFLAVVATAAAAPHSRLARPGPDGRLVYAPTSLQGDILPDFSHCGYGGGGVPLPDVPEVLRLRPSTSGDDGGRIQEAIDAVSRRSLDARGFRGAVVLGRGEYRVSGSLRIAASGVVLRGEGSGPDGTVLRATGTTQRRLIEVYGAAGPVPRSGSRVRIADAYVPVGARSFVVADASGIQAGATVFVQRIGNAAWISEIGMDRIKGRPGREETTRQWQPFTLAFDRVVTRIEGNRVFIDAPITCAIDDRWGGGEVVPYDDPGRIERVGVEHLRGVSDFDPSVVAEHRTAGRYAADEAHAVYFVAFNRVKNAWARDLVALHFYHGTSMIDREAKWVTVRDSASLDPVSRIEGGRRYPFAIDGQLGLVIGCRSEGARHAFVVGSRVCGPNAFVHSVSTREYGDSEPHHRWSVGGLYDNVTGNIAIQDRQWAGSGHGWAGANYVAWNTRGTLVCQKPPTAQNFAIGHVGPKSPGSHPREDGHWESHGTPVEPSSLYARQLQDRLGPDARP